MLNDQEIFSFELHETLFLKRGQEVQEVIGISLDPNISIQSQNDYTIVKGTVTLEGEYEKKEASLTDEDLPLLETSTEVKRFIKNTNEDDKGYINFSHDFPIEISIPSYRIVDAEKVAVYVDSFDYELEAPNELRIHSLIHIYGIRAYANASELSESEMKRSGEQDSSTLETLERSEEDFVLHEEQLLDEEEKEELRNEEETNLKTALDQSQLQIDPEEEPKEEEMKHEENLEESAELMEGSFPKEEDYEDELERLEILENEFEQKPETSTKAEERESQEEEESLDEENFLTTWLSGRREEEEELSQGQLRIYIVQEDETLDEIAERYEVSKNQIIQKNHLENDRIDKGQLLTIPKN